MAYRLLPKGVTVIGITGTNGKTTTTTLTYELMKKAFGEKVYLTGNIGYPFCSILDKLSQTYNYSDAETVAGILWGYGTQECMRKKDFIQCLEVEFEGKTYNAPLNYNQYLTQLYSNYMELPPEEKRVRHEYEAYIM